MSAPPSPSPDADSAPFWAGLHRHELLVQRCDKCAALQFPFRPACSRCLAALPGTVPVSGRGTVLSWIVSHRVFHPAFADRVPYTTVLVRLAEQDDLLMYGTWLGAQPPQAEGVPVVARFADHDDFTLVEWEPAA
jgi:uncharacterized protein